MAEALLIGKSDLQAYTALNANVDSDKIIPFIKIAQDIWVLQYVGTDLMTKIKSDIAASTLTGNYATLVNTYLKPMLIHFTILQMLLRLQLLLRTLYQLLMHLMLHQHHLLLMLHQHHLLLLLHL